MIRCLHCGAETSNGLALCELCRRFAGECLAIFPVYFRNLARWRPGRAGSRPVHGSRALYDGPKDPDSTGDRISDRLDEALTMATTRARELVKDRPHFPRPLTFTDAVLCDDLPQSVADELNDDPARAMAALCAGFEEHLTSIATLDWAGDFVRDLSHHETTLRLLTETSVPGWYAGGCRQLIGFDEDGAAVRCGTSTYVVPGFTWVTCGGCGATTYARDHLEVVLDEARDWIARPKPLAQALVALLDTEPSVPRLYDRIRRWSADEALTAIRQTTREHVYDDETKCVVVTDEETGPARYRLGDVLALILRETTRKAQISKNTAAAS